MGTYTLVRGTIGEWTQAMKSMSTGYESYDAVAADRSAAQVSRGIGA